MASQYLDGSEALLPTYLQATSYVENLDRHLSHLHSLLTDEKT